MGLFFVVLAGLFILLVFFCILQAFRRRIANCCSLVYRKLEATLFYNSLIRYMIEGNLKLTFTHIFILAEESSFDTDEEKAKRSTSMGFTIIIIIWIIFALIFPIVKRHRLEDNSYKKRYGSMYEDIKTKTPLPVLYTGLFCMRRFFLVIALLYLKESPQTMIYCYLMLNSLYFIYLVHAESNMEPVMNILEYINELSLIALLYAMLFYVKTNQLDALVVWDAGVAAIAILCTAFLINLGYLVVSSVLKSIQMGKLKVIRYKRI